MAEYKIKGLANNNSQMQPQYNIKGNYPNSSPMGIGSIPGDISDAIVNLIMSGGEKAMQLPDEVSSAGQQISDNPLPGTARATGSFLSSLAEGAKQLYNLPLNLNTYLGSKGIPPFKQTMGLAEKLKVGDTGLQKAILGEQRPGDVLWEDIGSVAPMFLAPESVTTKIPAVTSKGIMKQLSKEKSIQHAISKSEYSDLFKEASENGLTHVAPPKEVIKNKQIITENSLPKFHESLKTYISDPTLENAHWAQSELGYLKRFLDKKNMKSGLTPSELKTYKSTVSAQDALKKSMFSKDLLGNNPSLALKYSELANKYKTNVIPYKTLEELSEFESGKLRPRSAVKDLLNNEEFMINLSRKYPGIFLHTPTARNLSLGTAGLLGYDEIKRLMSNSSQ